MGKLKTLFRRIAVKSHAPKTELELYPLEKIKTVNAFIDVTAPDAPSLVNDLKNFFGGRGIELRIYSVLAPEVLSAPSIEGVTIIPSNKLNLIGSIRKSRKHPLIKTGEDMFLGLSEGDFAADFAAICSDAKMKVGRTSAQGTNIFNLRILNAEAYDQTAVFAQMVAILTDIK